MALVIGTNSGFVSVAPTADPAGSAGVVDNRVQVTHDTSPAGATKITEVGWYCQNATEAGNFEVGLYAADGAVVPGEAGTRLYVSGSAAKGTDVGWVSIAVDWNISESTSYWIGFHLDDTATATNTDGAGAGGSGRDSKTGSSLPNPFGGGALEDSDGMVAIYAVYGAAGGTHYTEGVAGTECFTGAIGRKYMGDRLLTGEF